MASEPTQPDEIVHSVSTLEDPRSPIHRRHPLPSILAIAVVAVRAAAAGPTAIARWAELKEELLAGILDRPDGIPGTDVVGRVLMPLPPEAVEAAVNAGIARRRDEATAVTGVERPIIACDGKSARHRHDAKTELGALHVVTAWAGGARLAGLDRSGVAGTGQPLAAPGLSPDTRVWPAGERARAGAGATRLFATRRMWGSGCLDRRGGRPSSPWRRA